MRTNSLALSALAWGHECPSSYSGLRDRRDTLVVLKSGHLYGIDEVTL
jgi:hypothetical protein